jgi:hypothetical protein
MSISQNAHSAGHVPTLENGKWKIPVVVDAGTVVWREPSTAAELALVEQHREEAEAVAKVRERRAKAEAKGNAGARAGDAPATLDGQF